VASPEIATAAVAAVEDVTGEAIEVDTEGIVEIEGMIEEEEEAEGEEGLVVEVVTEDVDVDLHLIVQCHEADHDPKVLQGGDAVAVVVQDQDLAPDPNKVTSNTQKHRRIITVVSLKAEDKILRNQYF